VPFIWDGLALEGDGAAGASLGASASGVGAFFFFFFKIGIENLQVDISKSVSHLGRGPIERPAGRKNQPHPPLLPPHIFIFSQSNRNLLEYDKGGRRQPAIGETVASAGLAIRRGLRAGAGSVQGGQGRLGLIRAARARGVTCLLPRSNCGLDRLHTIDGDNISILFPANNHWPFMCDLLLLHGLIAR